MNTDKKQTLGFGHQALEIHYNKTLRPLREKIMHKRFPRKPTFITAAILISLICFNCIARAQSLEQARWKFDEFYKYDKDLPFNLKERPLRETDTYKLYHWTFTSVHGKRVTALFLTPKNLKKPVPVILVLHGYLGSKNEMLAGADIVPPAGYACLALDAEYHGERTVAGKSIYSKQMYSSRDAMVQTIVDYRRAVDLLETRREIDPKRIGYMGNSMGGIIGAVITAVEPRIRAATLVVGGADWAYLSKASVVSEELGLTKGKNPLNPKKFQGIIAPADPINWAQKISPRPVLMLNAKYDILVNPLANKKLFARLNEPKKIIWFANGHDLPPDTVISITLDFFNAYLKGSQNPTAFGTIVEGYKTTPLSMKLKTPLPEPVIDMPLVDLFNYDSFLPLNAAVKKIDDAQWNNHNRVSWMSMHDKTVPGDLYLPEPPEKGPFPAVVYLRELNSNTQEPIEILPVALSNGYAVLVMDLEYSGKRALPSHAFLSPLIYTTRDNMLQSLFDVRRAYDFLATCPEIASNSGFILATSGKINSQLAAIVTAIDDRTHTLLLIPGKHYDEFLKNIDNIKSTGRYDALQDALSWATPSIYSSALSQKRILTMGSSYKYIEATDNQTNITHLDSINSVFKNLKTQ